MSESVVRGIYGTEAVPISELFKGRPCIAPDWCGPKHAQSARMRRPGAMREKRGCGLRATYLGMDAQQLCTVQFIGGETRKIHLDHLEFPKEMLLSPDERARSFSRFRRRNRNP